MKGKATWFNTYIFTIVFLLVFITVIYSITYYEQALPCNAILNKYVSSRGILQSCDVHSKNPVSSTKTFDIDISKIENFSTVYITASAIPTFAESLNKIDSKFILVSGDCDESVPDMIFNENSFLKFIESDKIICWFTQNCTRVHPKLIPIPIGLDYHTLSKSSMVWGKQKGAEMQEKELISIKEASLPFYKRKISCYSNFHFNKSKQHAFTYDRDDAISLIPKELVYYEPKPIPRDDSWNHQAEYAFVVSPHGNGLDCHRTWEALILGCIPIVKTSTIDSLYDNLPVLIVDRWSDVSIELLEKTVIMFKTMNFEYDKLTLKYWIDKIQDAKNV